MSNTHIIQMYNDLIPLNKIAESSNIPLRDVLDTLENYVSNFQYLGAPNFTQAYKKDILIQYVDFYKSTKIIAKEGGHCPKTVSGILHHNNVELRGNKKISEKDGYEIVEMIKNADSIDKISKKFHVSRSCILRWLKKNKIPVPKYKPTPQSQEKARKHHFNKRFFKELDSEAPVYYLALFATDGYFLKDNDKLMGIEIGQKASSAPLLDKLLEVTNSDGELKDRSYDYTYKRKGSNEEETRPLYSKVASFSSIEMAEDVREQLGLPKDPFTKTLDLSSTKNIPLSFENAFCRAALDGDGTINYSPGSNKKEKDMYVSIYGAESFLEGIREMICRHCDVSFIRIKPKRKNAAENSNPAHLYELSWSGRVQVLKVLDWIYKDATIYLEEKYLKYLSIDRKKRHIDLSELIDGPSLRIKRKKQELSQLCLARMVSCSQAVISEFEQEKRTKMTCKIARSILDTFNIKFDDNIFYY